MAYDPTIPALNHYVGDDIPKIMANFSELAGSRIVDHNLDVADPPNGWYAKTAVGLQLCWHRISIDISPEIGRFRPVWVYPSEFTATPYLAMTLPFGRVTNWIGFSRDDVKLWGHHPGNSSRRSAEFVIFYDGPAGVEIHGIEVFAIGVALP